VAFGFLRVFLLTKTLLSQIRLKGFIYIFLYMVVISVNAFSFRLLLVIRRLLVTQSNSCLYCSFYSFNDSKTGLWTCARFLSSCVVCFYDLACFLFVMGGKWALIPINNFIQGLYYGPLGFALEGCASVLCGLAIKINIIKKGTKERRQAERLKSTRSE